MGPQIFKNCILRLTLDIFRVQDKKIGPKIFKNCILRLILDIFEVQDKKLVLRYLKIGFWG